jgi:hypothetical protein
MNNKLILEINRQKKLMGLVVEATGPGPITSWGGKLFKQLMGTNVYSGSKSSFIDAFEKVKDLPSFSSFKSKGIKTFEDLVNDAKNINRIGNAGGQTGLLHKMTDSEYLIFVKDFVRQIFKEPSLVNLRQGVYNEYKKLLQPSDKAILDDLENFALNDDFASYSALKKSVQNRTPPTFDSDILSHIESKFSRENINDIGKDDWVTGLYNVIVKDNILISWFTKTKTKTNAEIEEYFIEFDQILQDFSRDLSNGITTNKENYLRRLNEIMTEIKKGETITVTELWKNMKDRIPENLKPKFENPDGTVNIGQFKEWVKYYDDLSGTSGRTIIEPEPIVTKLEALKRAITNPPLGPELAAVKRVGWWANFGKRLGNFLRRGTFRLKAERELNKKIMGSGVYKGYQAGELFLATFLYGPAVWAFLKTWGDLLERNEVIPDWVTFNKENFTDPSVKESSLTGKAFGKVMLRNFADQYGFSLEELEAGVTKGFSPGIFIGLEIIKILKTGGTGPITQTEIENGLKQVKADTLNLHRALEAEPTLSDIVEDTTVNAAYNEVINLDSVLQQIER